jgi:hypothetical protein
VPVAVSATHDLPLQAFSVSLWFPPGQLRVAEVSYAGTSVEPLNPEYFSSTVDRLKGNVALAVIFEVSPPLDLVALPASPLSFRTVATVYFDVLPAAVPGPTVLHLADSPALHPVKNVFVNLGTSIAPLVEDGVFEVLPRPFRRAHVNGDGRVDLSDAVFLFSFLFLGGPAPECLPAANVNGDRRVDLSDGIWLLGWMFRGSAPPLEPFRECGDDPGPPLRAPCDGAAACP